SLVQAVHRQTEGNPLFVQEVIRYLAEDGQLAQASAGGGGGGQTPITMTIPEGLREVIGKRLSRLSQEANRLLAVAAVIGRDFELGILQAVAGAPEETVLAGLEEAVRVGVLEQRPRQSGMTFRFAHAFFR